MKTVDLIIFGGQSNMQGESERLSECETVQDALEYKYMSDTLRPLANPVGEDIRYDGSLGVCFSHENAHITPEQWCAEHVLGSSCEGHTNLVPAFCRAYIKRTGTPVVAVHAAKGSTRVDQWLPGSDGYRMLSAKASAAIARAGKEFSVRHVYFVWLQGESDAIESVSGALYKERLTELQTALAGDLGVEKFGIIRVGRFTGDARDDEIIDAQSEICRENPAFLMLTEIATELNGDPEMMNPFVGGHFSAEGLETLGRAAGDALAAYALEH